MKSKLYILIMGLALLFIGSIIAIPEVINLKMANNIEYAYNYGSHNYIYYITDDKKIYLNNVDVIYDDNLDNQMMIESHYYAPFIKNIVVKARNYNHNIKIEIAPEFTLNFNEIGNTYGKIVTDLKSNVVYDYRKLFAPKTTIKVNQKYKNQIIVK